MVGARSCLCRFMDIGQEQTPIFLVSYWHMEQTAKYIQIAKTLQRDILAGKYESHSRFPSEEMLARRFGASRPTIERALRELKRGGFLEARTGSGFYLTLFARNATGVIGVIAPDYRKIDFFTDLCDEIVYSARAAGYDVLLGDVSVPDAADRASWALLMAKAFAQRKMAGVLLEPIDLVPGSTEATKAVLDVFRDSHIPVVLIDRDYLPPPARSQYDLVGIDNFQAGYRIAKHMIDAGAHSLRFLTQPNYASTIRSRIHGVAQAAIDARLKWRNDFVIETDPEDKAFFARLIRGKNAPDAFICRNDNTAARLLQTLSQLKLKIPSDVRVAGFDDGNIAKLLNPPLTTIRQPVKTLAETSVASLIQRMRSPDLAPRTILLDADLIVRKSSS